ncbi:hypothetical protein U9M48_042038 [Paspalum notatum var. saurae]|uniref:Uncharacterized protein n=1 Tax=Paspalum notatum var. saurae TaxID=547442 RepID=A0AAQ3URT9_PASNO
MLGCGDRRVAKCRRHRTAPVDPQAVYESGGGKSHGRYSMFNGMIDSRQVRRRSSSQSSGGSSSRQHRTTSEMEFDSLRQEIQKQVAPAPVLPQWGMFAHMSFSPAPQGSGVQGSNPYQTPPPASGQHEDQQSGQHIDPALGDFVNNLFASGGSGHNSNEPGAMAALALERLIFGG